MKFKTFSVNADYVKIIPLADLHLGNLYTDINLIKKVIQRIKEDKFTYTVLLGDVFETAIIDSVGDVYDSEKPEKEFDLAVKLLEPIKDKIICSVGGNHERRISKRVGVDLGSLLAKRLGIDYSEGYYTIKLKLPTTSWYLVLHHGIGASRTKGGKINSMMNIGKNVGNADLIISGHLHDFIETTESVFVIDKKHDKISEHTIRYIMIPAFMDYGGYAEFSALPKTVRGFVEIGIPDCANRVKDEVGIDVRKYYGGRLIDRKRRL